MSAEATTTTDHEHIRRWAEERGGRPATVRRTEADGEPGVLRIDFQEPDEDLEEISWEDWFDKFEQENLAFLHQERTADGSESRFFKLVER